MPTQINFQAARCLWKLRPLPSSRILNKRQGIVQPLRASWDPRAPGGPTHFEGGADGASESDFLDASESGQEIAHLSL